MSTAITPYNPSNNQIFNPTQISGCALWLDAADTNSITQSNGNVSVWRDKSGNTGRDATAVSNPKLSAINGVQAMNMTTASYFTGAVSITTTTLTCFAVANTTRTLPNVAGSDQRLVSLANTTNVDHGRVDGTIALFNQVNSSGIAVWRTPGLIGLTPITTNTPFLAVSQYTGTNGFIWGNGTAGSTTGTASSGSFAITKYGIGNQANPTLEYWVGTIGEVIIYNIALTTNERQQIEGYLAWKWGTQRSLPTTHPYYNNAYLPNSYPISYFPPRISLSSVIPVVPGFTIPTTIRQYVFNPTSITGAALWLDAADPFNNGAQPNSGTVISTWSDKSGNGRNGTTTSNIIYTRDPQGRVAQLITSNQRYSIPTFVPSLTSQITVFCVINQLTTVGTGNVDMIAGTPYNNFTMNLADSTNRFGIYLNNGIPSLTTTYGTINRPAIYEATYSPNTGTAFVNGSNFGSFTTVPGTALTTSQVFTLGGNPTTNFYYHELLFYNTTLTVGQRQQVEGYLAWKWGIQSNLPANHPYKLFPP